MNTAQLKGYWNVVKGKFKNVQSNDDLQSVRSKESAGGGRNQKRPVPTRAAVELALDESNWRGI